MRSERNSAKRAAEREIEGLTFFGGVAATGVVARVEKSSLAVHPVEEDEAQRKSATRMTPRRTTAASTSRRFAGSAFAAGDLAMRESATVTVREGGWWSLEVDRG